ncbi:hypothetical protein C8R46DRAFT_646887 [Mycena filopes]|nr:hypothetical protein C8R46DRAFT_88070 [Mycena filopes]KAJ7179678.1 hypothetical protein C8R46DRAFT_646887 [Mycena filopes]
MSAPGPTSLPTALVVPIIQGYVDAIRPAFPFILILTVFAAMLVPLLIMMFALSTPQSRRGPIFILNILAISSGIFLGVLGSHLWISSILFPFAVVSIVEDLIFTIFDIWLSWFTEAVLLIRIAAAFPRSQLPALLAFPVAIKIGRVVVNVLFSINWIKITLRGGLANQFSIISTQPVWFQVGFILELADNGYISALFLWRLAEKGHLFKSKAIGRVNSSKSSSVSRLQHLFWIASTNFVFPLMFGVAQIVAIFTGQVLLAASLQMANTYVEIIATVFATIWSSTASFESATNQVGTAASYSNNGTHPTLVRMDRVTVSTSDNPSGADVRYPAKSKSDDWEDYQYPTAV